MNEFLCENFLSPVNPNESGYVQSKNFLRQWYLHGPFPMDADTRSAAQAGDWAAVLDVEAMSGEANIKPNMQPVADPREMVKDGTWMRWETSSISRNFTTS